MALPTQQQKHIETWQENGLMQTAYCHQYKLNSKTFSNWLRVYRSQQKQPQLRRIRYSAKSESLSQLQLSLFEEAWEIDAAAIEAEIEQLPIPTNRPPRMRAGCRPLPDHSPRIEHRHEPESCQCNQCGHYLVTICEDVSEQLDIEPAKFFAHPHICPQYACKTCETTTAAAIPSAVIDGGMAVTKLYFPKNRRSPVY